MATWRMREIAARTIKKMLDELPGAPRTQFGLLTFDSASDTRPPPRRAAFHMPACPVGGVGVV